MKSVDDVVAELRLKVAKNLARDVCIVSIDCDDALALSQMAADFAVMLAEGKRALATLQREADGLRADAALSALGEAGYELNKKGTREALEHTRTSLGHAIDVIRRNVARDALGTNSDGDADVPGGYRSWPLLDEYLHYMDESMTKSAAMLSASQEQSLPPQDDGDKGSDL